MVLPIIQPIADANRTFTYNVTVATSNFNVPFPIFGTGEDVLVYVGGYQQQQAGSPGSGLYPFNFVSQSGTPIAQLPLPITDGQIQFTTPVAPVSPATSIQVTISGNWQPRQNSVPTAPAITRYEFQQVIGAIIASLREISGSLQQLIPFSPAQRANTGLIFDANGNAALGALPSAFVSAALIPVLAATTIPLAQAALGLASIPNVNLAPVANATVKGNLSGASGIPSDVTLAALFAYQLAVFTSGLAFGASAPAHSVVIAEAAAAAQFAGPGSIGTSLVGLGGGADPAFKAGARVLLNTLTASNNASLTDSTSLVTAGYTDFEFVFENVVLSAGASLLAQFTSGGSLQTTNYSSCGSWVDSNSSGTNVATTNGVSMVTSRNGTLSVGIVGRGVLYNAQGTTAPKVFIGELSYSYATATTGNQVVSGAWMGGNTAITGVTFTPSGGGTITSGQIRIYGMT